MSQQSGGAKRSEKGLLTPDNCLVTLIDLQTPNALRRRKLSTARRSSTTNVALAKAARVFDVPVVLSTVETKGFSGNMWPQIQAVFPKQTPIERTTMNSWDDANFRRRRPEERPQEDRTLRLVDGDVRHPADDPSHPRRLRDLRRRGLLRRRQPARPRQRHEACGPGGCEAGHRALRDAGMATRLGAQRTRTTRSWTL